jgi:hypothetical protein
MYVYIYIMYIYNLYLYLYIFFIYIYKMNHTHMLVYSIALKNCLEYLIFFNVKDVFTFPNLEDLIALYGLLIPAITLIIVATMTSVNTCSSA